MRGLLGILLIAAFLPGVALAQENRPYVVMSGLFLALVESDENATSDEVGVSLEFEMDAGFGATLAFGYGANPGLSGEIEAGYRATQASGIENTEVNFPGSPTYALLQKIPVDADLNTLSLMANGYYTIDAKVFRPYVGAGIGLAQHKAKYPMLNLPTPVVRDEFATRPVRRCQRGIPWSPPHRMAKPSDNGSIFEPPWDRPPSLGFRGMMSYSPISSCWV